MSYGREVVAALLKAGRRDLPAQQPRQEERRHRPHHLCRIQWCHRCRYWFWSAKSLGLATMHFTQGKEMLLFTPKGERFAKKHGGARR